MLPIGANQSLTFVALIEAARVSKWCFNSIKSRGHATSNLVVTYEAVWCHGPGRVAILAIRYAIQKGFRSMVTAVTTDQAAACLSLTGSTTTVEAGNTDAIGTFRDNRDPKFGQVSSYAAAEISTVF